jgi:hypothetical protein
MIAADLGRAVLFASIPAGYGLHLLTLPQLYAVTFGAGEGSVLAGARFIASSALVRASLMAVATVNFFNLMFAALYLLYTVRVLHIEAGVVGVLMMLDISIGAIFAAVIPDTLRSRVTGAFQAVNYGTRPLGALLGGLLGSTIGLRPALWVATLGGLAGFALLLPTPLPRYRLPA